MFDAQQAEDCLNSLGLMFQCHVPICVMFLLFGVSLQGEERQSITLVLFQSSLESSSGDADLQVNGKKAKLAEAVVRRGLKMVEAICRNCSFDKT